MSKAGDKLRAAAESHQARMQEVLAENETGINTDFKAQLAAIVAGVSSRVCLSLAEALDELEAAGNPVEERLRAIVKRNDQIRKAAIHATDTGNWDEFERAILGDNGSADDGDATDS